MKPPHIPIMCGLDVAEQLTQSMHNTYIKQNKCLSIVGTYFKTKMPLGLTLASHKSKHRLLENSIYRRSTLALPLGPSVLIHTNCLESTW